MNYFKPAKNLYVQFFIVVITVLTISSSFNISVGQTQLELPDFPFTIEIPSTYKLPSDKNNNSWVYIYRPGKSVFDPNYRYPQQAYLYVIEKSSSNELTSNDLLEGIAFDYESGYAFDDSKGLSIQIGKTKSNLDYQWIHQPCEMISMTGGESTPIQVYGAVYESDKFFVSMAFELEGQVNSTYESEIKSIMNSFKWKELSGMMSMFLDNTDGKVRSHPLYAPFNIAIPEGLKTLDSDFSDYEIKFADSFFEMSITLYGNNEKLSVNEIIKSTQEIIANTEGIGELKFYPTESSKTISGDDFYSFKFYLNSGSDNQILMYILPVTDSTYLRIDCRCIDHQYGCIHFKSSTENLVKDLILTGSSHIIESSKFKFVTPRDWAIHPNSTESEIGFIPPTGYKDLQSLVLKRVKKEEINLSPEELAKGLIQKESINFLGTPASNSSMITNSITDIHFVSLNGLLKGANGMQATEDIAFIEQGEYYVFVSMTYGKTNAEYYNKAFQAVIEGLLFCK
ncbi:MAG: hypothetical protein H6598_09135 [Flavobacteriales bacterium]|nr:hypothetical protein [Flavobacteriales bacterium]MCB9196375.1 hypothetical protein [Flavobacteriales bacterium]